jgi:hypothetical protein
MSEKITGTQQLSSKNLLPLLARLSVVLFLILSVPANTKYIIEKQQGKIATLSNDEKEMIEELYHRL